MIEKGVSLPPRFNQQDVDLKAPGLLRYLVQLDIWLRAVRDAFPRVRTYESLIDPTTVGANTTSEQTFTVAGLATTDIVCVNKPTHQTGLALVAYRVSAKNTLALTFMNTTGSGIDPVEETYTITAIRK